MNRLLLLLLYDSSPFRAHHTAVTSVGRFPARSGPRHAHPGRCIADVRRFSRLSGIPDDADLRTYSTLLAQGDDLSDGRPEIVHLVQTKTSLSASARRRLPAARIHCQDHALARQHRWYMTSRLITVYDIYSFEQGESIGRKAHNALRHRPKREERRHDIA
jgi:hypothetical protein